MIGHKKQWDILKKKFELNQLSHAYLFVGQKEIGKRAFAKEFAEFIGCKFPDLLIVSEANKKDPKFGDGGEIKILQIREVQNFLSYKSYNGGYKVVIVEDAEKMNVEAQSCFLKTLEEPKGQTLIILITSKPDMLMATIASRCQTLKFFKPKNLPKNSERAKKESEILQELLPIIDSNLAEKFKYVKSIDFDKQEPTEILEVLQKYYREILLKDYSQKKVIKILSLIEDINNKLIFTNANPKLALEIVLMEL
jgi:DNA polymerase-3 subunit delta'